MVVFDAAGTVDDGPDPWSALAESLAGFAHFGTRPNGTDATPAAVLLLLYEKNGEQHIVLTKRTTRVATHKGEISFPGGAYEADKDATLLHTALREAAEEVGIVAGGLRVLGRLPSIIVQSSNYLVAPWVAVSNSPLEFSIDPTEVDQIIEVPLADLRRPEVRSEEEWLSEGKPYDTIVYAHGEHRIWGATARILNEFFAVLELAEAGQATR